MGNLFTEEVGKVLTRLLGNYLTEALGKVLDIYRSASPRSGACQQGKNAIALARWAGVSQMSPLLLWISMDH